jgi:hypothetical protein
MVSANIHKELRARGGMIIVSFIMSSERSNVD